MDVCMHLSTLTSIERRAVGGGKIRSHLQRWTRRLSRKGAKYLRATTWRLLYVGRISQWESLQAVKMLRQR